MGLYGRIRGYEEEGEGETTRSALMRSDDGGDNWEYYSTLAYDPASIIDYEEPALLRLKDGRLVSFMRTHVNPSGDAKNMVFVVSEDDGFSWTPPKWTNIWGYPAETHRASGRPLSDDLRLPPPALRRARLHLRGRRHLGREERVRRPRGRRARQERGRPPRLEPHEPARQVRQRRSIGSHPGVYQHIGYPSVAQMPDGTIVASLPRVERGRPAAAICALHPVPVWPTEPRAPGSRRAAHQTVLRDEHAYLAHPHLARAGRRRCSWSATGRRAGAFVLHPPEDPFYCNLLLRSADEGATLERAARGAGPMAGAASSAPA